MNKKLLKTKTPDEVTILFDLRTKKESPPPPRKKNQKQKFYSTSDCVFTLPMQDMDAAMEEGTDGRDTDTEDTEEGGADTENVSLYIKLLLADSRPSQSLHKYQHHFHSHQHQHHHPNHHLHKNTTSPPSRYHPSDTDHHYYIKPSSSSSSSSPSSSSLITTALRFSP